MVVGGGSVASRKVHGLLADGGRVRVVSPKLSRELLRLSESGSIEWLRKEYSQDVLQDAFLVFAATDKREVQEAVFQDAVREGRLVNVADSPESCTFHVPATVRHGSLTLAVSTNGRSPAVAAMIRERLEEEFGPEYEVLLDLMTAVRNQVLTLNSSQEERKILFKNLLKTDILVWIRTGQWEKVERCLRSVAGPDLEIDFIALGEKKS